MSPVDSELTELAAALRRARDADAERMARDTLAVVVCEKVQEVLGDRIAVADREDIVQDTTLLVIGAIERREVTEGKEDAFAAACARMAAKQFYSRRGARREVLLEESHEPLHFETPERALLDRMEEVEAHRLQRLVLRLVDEAPTSYQHALRAVYLSEQPRSIDDLVEEEHRRRGGQVGTAAADPDDHKRARAAVDTRLHRARRWLLRRVERALGGGSDSDRSGRPARPRALARGISAEAECPPRSEDEVY